MNFFTKKLLAERPLPDIEAPVSAASFEVINSFWRPKAGDLLEHNGVPNDSMKCSINIRDNPLLLRAIEEIKNGYFDLGVRSWRVENERPRLQLRSTKRTRSLDVLYNEVNNRIIAHTAKSMRRLQSPDYGFTSEEKAKIIGDAPPGIIYKPLMGEEAHLIIGKIIGRSLDCLQESIGKPRVNIPADGIFEFNGGKRDYMGSPSSQGRA